MNAILCQLGQLLDWLLLVYTLILLVYAVLSWIPDLRGSRFEAWLAILVEPLLNPIRRIIPPIGGLDIAFLILILLIQFLIRPLVGNLVTSACIPIY